ncbi:glycosyltransferase family 39 protein [Anaerolineales bacterium HSG24]|nr:glycosyltransferase family 39 protein [Anaerolineales bacterium HSG24]
MRITNYLIPLGLFLLTLIPRAYDLSRFTTADEAKWVYRSAQFLAAFLSGDFAATSVNLTPAVTTTWLGSIGLIVYHYIHQAELGLPLIEWLHTLPEFRAALPHLVAVRWPMVIFTSLTVALSYLLAQRLFGSTIALIGTIFIALDPHTISLSRIIGHDAPTAMFILLSLLFLLSTLADSQDKNDQNGGQTFRFERPIWATWATMKIWIPIWIPKNFLLSGVMAGLAFLSKAPSLFLIPFVGLVLFSSSVVALIVSRGGTSVRPFRWADLFMILCVRLLAWLGMAYLTFVLIWPAAWQAPLAAPYSVIENAFLSATDSVEASQDGYWLVPNLGLFYYIVYGGFKLSPLVMVGLMLALWRLWHRRAQIISLNRSKNLALCAFSVERQITWLFLFALLFTIFMTLADKRSPRYILPIFPALSFVAAYGWFRIVIGYPNPNSKQLPLLISLTISAMLIVLPYMPYYYNYYNPLLGGTWFAPRLVKIGWGEGLDQVGRYLQRTQPHSRVGVAYASTVAPYFQGRIGSVTGSNLDAVVLYRKQIQSGEPDPIFITYFQHMDRLFQVNLNGLNYAQVYAGPTLTMLSPAEGESNESESNEGESNQPVAFRPLSKYGSIGQPLMVDVLWSVEQGTEHNQHAPTVSLYPLDQSEVIAVNSAPIEAWADNLRISRHLLSLPLTLERGRYQLYAGDQPLGEIDLRHFELPDPTLSQPANRVVFNDQIAIIGYRFIPTEDYISVRLAWQSRRSPLPDYTVFVQLIDMETNERVAGFDSQPVQGAWPTSRWLTNEVIMDEILIAVPPDLSSGYYSIIVGLYQPETGQRLTLANGQDHWLLPWTFIWGDVE